ncbi:MAG: FG-GAP-like repeat-containing protein [Chloroflexota bacterium]
MRRPQAVGLCAVMLGLLVILPSSTAAAEAGRPTSRPLVRTPARLRTPDAVRLARSAPEAVAAGTADQSCTGWRSTVLPPPTLRVLQLRGPDAGKVYRDPTDPTGQAPLDVPFKDYVATVLAAEWPSGWPPEALKVGALAVKQYAWYFAIVWRGGVDVDGNCYDVTEGYGDQYYDPVTQSPSPAQLAAIDATWSMHLRKHQSSDGRGRFILTGYRSGSTLRCGTDSDHWRLYQHGVFGCARGFSRGGNQLDMEEILRAYLEPRLEIVTPGGHDILGDAPGQAASEAGDPAAIVEKPGGALVPNVWQLTKALAGGPAAAMSIDISGPGLIGFSSDDVDGDGHDDLVIARRVDATSISLDVARSDGSDYRPERAWATRDIGMDGVHARFYTGDFNGDGLPDAGLLVPSTATDATLLVFPATADGTFGKPRTWWTGPLDLTTTQVLDGDINGDGRDDLVAIVDLGPGGRRYDTAVSSGPATPGLGPWTTRWTAPELVGDVVRHVVADATRDGRDDVIALVDGAHRTHIDILRAPASGRKLQPIVAWRSPLDQKLPFAKLKVSTADVDDDGLWDLVVYRDLGAGGVEIGSFRTRSTDPYGTLTPGPSVTDPDVDWGALRPY